MPPPGTHSTKHLFAGQKKAKFQGPVPCPRPTQRQASTRPDISAESPLHTVPQGLCEGTAGAKALDYQPIRPGWTTARAQEIRPVEGRCPSQRELIDQEDPPPPVPGSQVSCSPLAMSYTHGTQSSGVPKPVHSGPCLPHWLTSDQMLRSLLGVPVPKPGKGW